MTWKSIHGYPGYEASACGEVRAIKWRGGSPRVLALHNADGYKRAKVRLDGKQRNLPAHRAVMLAFVGPPPAGKTEVAHLNGVRDDNRLENLSWVDQKENASHRPLHGTAPIGERHGYAKLTEAQATSIRAEYKRGNGPQLARKYGVSPDYPRSLAVGRSWKHLNP